jgi:hypothetical protein
MTGGKKQAHMLTQVRGAAAAGRDLCIFLSFPFFSFLFCSVVKYSFISRDEG